MSDARSTKTCAKIALTPIEHRTLECGAVTLHDFSNVAMGTGAAVHLLVRRGLMRLESQRVGEDGYRLHRYVVTPRGRNAYLSYGDPAVPVTPETTKAPATPALQGRRAQ